MKNAAYYQSKSSYNFDIETTTASNEITVENKIINVNVPTLEYSKDNGVNNGVQLLGYVTSSSDVQFTVTGTDADHIKLTSDEDGETVLTYINTDENTGVIPIKKI